MDGRTTLNNANGRTSESAKTVKKKINVEKTRRRNRDTKKKEMAKAGLPFSSFPLNYSWQTRNAGVHVIDYIHACMPFAI